MPAKRKAAKKLREYERLKQDLRKDEKVLQESLDYLKKHVDKLWEYATDSKDRLHDLEIQVNLITRLLTTLCIEVLKMKPKTFRKMIKKIEDEAIAESQILHLEELFRLESGDKGDGEEKQRKHT